MSPVTRKLQQLIHQTNEDRKKFLFYGTMLSLCCYAWVFGFTLQFVTPRLMDVLGLSSHFISFIITILTFGLLLLISRKFSKESPTFATPIRDYGIPYYRSHRPFSYKTAKGAGFAMILLSLILLPALFLNEKRYIQNRQLSTLSPEIENLISKILDYYQHMKVLPAYEAFSDTDKLEFERAQFTLHSLGLIRRGKDGYTSTLRLDEFLKS